jgi:hypothetical protein
VVIHPLCRAISSCHSSKFFALFCGIFRGLGKWLSIHFSEPFHRAIAASFLPFFVGFSEGWESGYPSTLQSHFIMPYQQVFMLSVKNFHNLPTETIHTFNDKFSQW